MIRGAAHGVFSVGAAHTRHFLKKVDKNFHLKWMLWDYVLLSTVMCGIASYLVGEGLAPPVFYPCRSVFRAAARTRRSVPKAEKQKSLPPRGRWHELASDGRRPRCFIILLILSHRVLPQSRVRSTAPSRREPLVRSSFAFDTSFPNAKKQKAFPCQVAKRRERNE